MMEEIIVVDVYLFELSQILIYTIDAKSFGKDQLIKDKNEGKLKV